MLDMAPSVTQWGSRCVIKMTATRIIRARASYDSASYFSATRHTHHTSTGCNGNRSHSAPCRSISTLAGNTATSSAINPISAQRRTRDTRFGIPEYRPTN